MNGQDFNPEFTMGAVVKRCPRGTRLQSLVFAKDTWAKSEARAWAIAHGYPSFVDDTKNFWRVRVEDPGHFLKESFRYGKPFLTGLRPLYGCPKAKHPQAPAKGTPTGKKVRPRRRVRRVAGVSDLTYFQFTNLPSMDQMKMILDAWDRKDQAVTRLANFFNRQYGGTLTVGDLERMREFVRTGVLPPKKPPARIGVLIGAVASWKDKLHPDRFSGMSPKMAAIVGYVTERDYTTPKIVSMMVTEDRGVLAMREGDVGYNDFIGHYNDLLSNWTNLLDAAGLTPDEKAQASKALDDRITVGREPGHVMDMIQKMDLIEGDEE